MLRALKWAVALLGAALVESYLTLESGLARAHDYLYGAPLSVGQCHSDTLFALGSGCSFSSPLFVANILLTGLVLAGTAEAGGLVGLFVGILVALVTVRVFPRAPDGTVDLLPVWLVAMALAAALGIAIPAAVRRLGRRRVVTPPSVRK